MQTYLGFGGCPNLQPCNHPYGHPPSCCNTPSGNLSWKGPRKSGTTTPEQRSGREFWPEGWSGMSQTVLGAWRETTSEIHRWGMLLLGLTKTDGSVLSSPDGFNMQGWGAREKQRSLKSGCFTLQFRAGPGDDGCGPNAGSMQNCSQPKVSAGNDNASSTDLGISKIRPVNLLKMTPRRCFHPITVLLDQPQVPGIDPNRTPFTPNPF